MFPNAQTKTAEAVREQMDSLHLIHVFELMRCALTGRGRSKEVRYTLNRLSMCEYLKVRQTEPGAKTFVCPALRGVLSHRHLLVKAGTAADITALVFSGKDPE